MQSTSTKSGFAVVLGRPSAGKSSLINAVCGHHVSIVSPVPQTTRNRIRGIYTEDRGQIVFLDTPGVHRSERRMNQRLREVALADAQESEVVLYLVDASRSPGAEEREIASLVASYERTTVVAVTKCDRSDAEPARAREFVARTLPNRATIVELGGLSEPESADPRESGVEEMLDALFPLLPEGPIWYPQEFYTDQQPTFRIAEIVREQAIARTREEIPHALYVEVADIAERDGAIRARVFLYVERESQKGILVGKNARTVTAIRTDSERLLASLFPQPVKLSIQVKVRPRWRHDENLLKRIIQ